MSLGSQDNFQILLNTKVFVVRTKPRAEFLLITYRHAVHLYSLKMQLWTLIIPNWKRLQGLPAGWGRGSQPVRDPGRGWADRERGDTVGTLLSPQHWFYLVLVLCCSLMPLAMATRHQRPQENYQQRGVCDRPSLLSHQKGWEREPGHSVNLRTNLLGTAPPSLPNSISTTLPLPDHSHKAGLEAKNPTLGMENVTRIRGRRHAIQEKLRLNKNRQAG